METTPSHTRILKYILKSELYDIYVQLTRQNISCISFSS